jgi:hypothetical protein
MNNNLKFEKTHKNFLVTRLIEKKVKKTHACTTILTCPKSDNRIKDKIEMETKPSRAPKRDRTESEADALTIQQGEQKQINTPKNAELREEEIAQLEMKEFIQLYRDFTKRIVALESEDKKNKQAIATQGEAIGKLNTERIKR